MSLSAGKKYYSENLKYGDKGACQAFLDKYNMINIYQNEHAMTPEWNPKLRRVNRWIALRSKTLIAGKFQPIKPGFLALVKIRGAEKWEYCIVQIPKNAGLKKLIDWKWKVTGDLKEMLAEALAEGKDFMDFTGYETTGKRNKGWWKKGENPIIGRKLKEQQS